MKTNFLKLMLLALVAMFTFASCEKDDNEPSKWIVKIGAQSNTSIGAFYSLSEKKIYNQTDAFNNQAKIDLVCFYEHDEINNRINDMTLSSPGANIRDIFTGETDVMNYTTKNLTTITPTSASSGAGTLPANTQSITVEQFDQIKQGEAIIATYFNSTLTSSNKKAKLLVANDIYAFKTQDGTYGLFKVVAVSEPKNASGWLQFEIKTYKPAV
ncbi:MAG: hypothetical protein F9K37_01460 [Bacteroidales bacterium]|nr:MAG: hypothetical protein F9K37_01460 [Bacteroidales bacterium]